VFIAPFFGRQGNPFSGTIDVPFITFVTNSLVALLEALCADFEECVTDTKDFGNARHN